MKIEEKDFVMEDVAPDSDKWDLAFYKRVKKRETGEYAIELGDKLYGLSLSSCLRRIAKHRIAKKYEEENITLRQFLKEYQLAYKEIVKLCRETLPEKFDTGE
jgi:hypothetical protein